MSPLGSKRAYGPFDPPRDQWSWVSFDPVARQAVQFLKEVGGIFELGIRFPFNNDSATDLTVSGTTTLTNKVNRYRDITVTATGVLTCNVTPCFMAWNG